MLKNISYKQGGKMKLNKMTLAAVVTIGVLAGTNAGYSQEQFAFKCDVDRTYIGTIERGEKSPTLNTIVKIANALGITKSELFNY